MIEIGNINSTPTNMVLEIKDVNNTVKVKYAIGEKDEINKELMQRHDLSISFNYPTFISFKKGDYVSFDSIKYYLMNDYKAVDNNGQYKYDLVFHGKEMLFQDVQYWYDKNNVDQSEYGMTGNATYFLQLAVENINKHYGADFVIQGNAEPTEIKYISFANNTNVFDALNQVCNTFDCEWLLEGDTINIVNKANFGDAVDFKVGETIQNISRRDGDNTFDAQRILALGSTRNLTEAYHGGDYMIGAKRLRIPTIKGKYIDLKPNLKPTEIKTATVIFDEIYPHRVGTMTAVRSVEYKDKDDDGKETILKQWRFKDNDIIFSEDYKLPDLPLTIVFQTGKLAGLHFDVEFVKSGYEENDNSQYYEIEANESYGAMLPNDTLKPEVGDKYILYNFNIELVSHVYVPEAENELFNYATKWLKDEWIDKGVYECPIMGAYARDNNVNLEIGQRVDLYSPLFNGKRESRVMAYSKPLLSEFDATYTIGDNKAYSSKSSINQRITKLELTEYADYNVSTGIGDVYVIKQFDNTRPSDFNVYSAKASNAKYFNKQTGDTVQGDTQFMRNVQTHGINISDVFQNSTFTAGALGSGFQVKRDSNGESYAEFDNLFVRKNTVFTEITKAEIKSVGGLIILSLADLTASDVVDNGNSYRVYFDTQDGEMVNKFALNDQVICQTFNGVEQKRYWRLVTGVGENYIDVSKTDAENNSKAPTKGDDIVQLGNRTDVNRQHAILLSAYGSDAPSIKQYSGINSYSLEGKEVTVISPSGNMFKGTFSIQSNGTTQVIYKDRGLFENGTQYYKNERVSWLGSLWVCLEDTKTIPSETATYWRKETSGQTDINNAVNQVRTEYQTGFEVLDTKIESKVSQTDFNALGQRVSISESNIIQLSDSITSTVEKVDNISVGGINLMNKSGNFINNTGSIVPNSSSVTLSIDNSETHNGMNSIRIDGNSGVYSDEWIELPPSSTYTYSIMAKASSEIKGGFVSGNWSPLHMWVSDKKQAGHAEIILNHDSTIRTDWHKSWITFKTPDDGKTYYLRPFIYSIGNSTVWVTSFKVELGNKATSWSPSPQDVQNEINSKAQTFYQDNEPTSKNIGDIWIKKALVDTNGNINSDQSKNIYQLQMRWNGSTWQRINWSASKSKIEQTDSQIRQTVEKAGIDQLGQGQNLYSVFNQRADEIELEVSKKTTEAEVKAGIKVTPNGVNVYGNEFEVDSTLIANAIETDDLEVVSKDSTDRIVSEFKVNSTGLLKAYGSNGADNYLDIDSNKRSIVIASKSSGSGIGDSVIGKSRTEMSESIGGIRSVSNNNISTTSTSVLSSVGLFANTAGQNMFPEQSAINAKSSIVGLGWGNVPYRKYSTTNKIHFESFTAGVYGESTNKGTAPSFGGFFNKLMAQGLFLSIRAVNTNTTLTNQDVVVTCYNQSNITLTLPTNPIVGQFLLIRKMNEDKVYIRTTDNNRIHTDGSTTTSVDIKNGRGDMSMVIFDGTYWTYNFFGK